MTESKIFSEEVKEETEHLLLCGPLLRYTYTDYSTSTWNGSILVVLKDTKSPGLKIQPSFDDRPRPKVIWTEKGRTFWRFPIKIPLGKDEKRVYYNVFMITNELSPIFATSFCVPAVDDSMRILFHSCNGFSTTVKPGTFAGPALWNDVLRTHSERPFHVMVGGGDQVYSDAIRVDGPLKEWANHYTPRHKAKVKLTESLKEEMDEWYFRNYCNWYTNDPFRIAAASIPTVQLFDDHDIIDGYGSYPDKFMKAPIFIGIGEVAWKYYMLFQQHTPPKGEEFEDPSWVIGETPGDYIKERSRSICTSFGKRIVFFGLDCRVERRLDRICRPSTYDAMFKRLDNEIIEGQTKHLLLLLGVPIAYPRLVWLEHLLSRYTVTPLKLLNKLFGLAGGVFNKFDGSAELLDDLYDHWCAEPHKEERNNLVMRLQNYSLKKKVRITILSGDVHLAAVGRFFSNEKLNIPQNKDHRYIVNVISSAITNAPPPHVVANLLSRRNKLHKLGRDTSENLMDIFTHSPSGHPNGNVTTMPARNYCVITENGGLTAPERQSIAAQGDEQTSMDVAHRQRGNVDGPSTKAPFGGTTRLFALDIAIRAEVEPTNPEGKTVAYGFEIPALEL